MLGVAGGWSRPVALDQAVGLAVHAAVVFARGVLPALIATGAACRLWRRRRGTEATAWGTLALAAVLSACFALPILTVPLGGWPRLEVRGTADAAATVALLAAAAAGAELLARRWPRPGRPLR